MTATISPRITDTARGEETASMYIEEFLAGLSLNRQQIRDGASSVEIRDVTHDSNAVVEGSVFVCIVGRHHDGHDYAHQAVSRGAVALVCERLLDVPDEVTQIVVGDARSVMAKASAVLWDHPSRDLTVVGVTGTAGKTSVTHVLASIFKAAGSQASIRGTLSGPRTTPESSDLQRWLRSEHERGVMAVAMEVSSHSLSLHRVDEIDFDVAVFTNLGRDHLDFHHSMDEYFEAKASLFEAHRCGHAVVNRDDVWGRRLIGRLEGLVGLTSFGVDDVVDVELTARGSRFVWSGLAMHTRLLGRYNLVNVIAAATAARCLGIDDAAITKGVEAVEPVPGRLEVIAGARTVVVDYAHKPEALVAALTSVRELTDGRVLVVFGAGGDRDRSKRPLMGAAAQTHADEAWVTSDNPRSEDPVRIIEEVTAAMTDPHILVDRRAAIRAAVAASEKSDIVVIAGKGHETTQTIGDEVLPFDDRVEALGAIEEVFGR
jgi:UDP-N-acetylmuramoyl-L-alanyl-D-glutamate--2,6-diaminopimelate ligase